MTHMMIAALPTRRHHASEPGRPIDRRRREEAFLHDHDGWRARALERLAQGGFGGGGFGEGRFGGAGR